MTLVSTTDAHRVDARGPDVLLIDDHPLLANALARPLESAGRSVEIADIGAGPSGLVASVIGRRPRLVVLDLGLPIEGGGLGLIEPLVAAGQSVAVLTGETDRLLWARCSAAGAVVVLSKAEPLDELLLAIDHLLAGRVVRPHQRPELAALLRQADAEHRRHLAGFDQLTGRERQILAGLMAGLGLRPLAQRHGVSIETVRSQVKSVMRKLGVNSQLEAVARATAAGWTGE